MAAGASRRKNPREALSWFVTTQIRTEKVPEWPQVFPVNVNQHIGDLNMDVKDLEENGWFRPLLTEVQREFDRLMIAEHDQRPVIQQELQGVERNIAGWSTSLANPALGA